MFHLHQFAYTYFSSQVICTSCTQIHMSARIPAQLMEKQRKKFASYVNYSIIQGIQLMTKLAQVFNEMTSICNNAALEFSKDIVKDENYQTFTKFRVSDSQEEKITLAKQQHQSQQKDENSPFQKIRQRKVLVNSPPQKIDETHIQQEFKQIKKTTLRKPSERTATNKTVKGSNLLPKLSVSPPLYRSSRRSQRIVEEKNEKTEKTTQIEKLQRPENNAEPDLKNTFSEKHTPEQKADSQPVPESNSGSPRLSRPRKKDPILEEKNEKNNEPLGQRVNRGNKKISITLSLSESDVSSEPSDYRSRRRQSSQRRTAKGVTPNKKKGNNRKAKRPQLKEGEEPTKRPLNGFMRFFQEVKDEVKRKYKTKQLPELSHMVSVEWKKLPKEEQKKYNNAYYEDMKRLKVQESEAKREEKLTKNQNQKNQDQSHQEYEQEVIPNQSIDENSEPQSNEESASGQVSEQESESPSSEQQEQQDSDEDEPQQSKTPESQNKQRQIRRVKRPSTKEDKIEETAKKSKEEESGSEQFSISQENDDENRNQRQQNSESVIAENKKSKSSRSNKKSSRERKSSSGRRKQ